MPFVITRPQPHGKLYIEQQDDGEMLWTAAKNRATPMEERLADAIAAEINAYASTLAQVEGIKVEHAEAA